MATLISSPTTGSHWYSLTGDPVHEVKAAKGGMRATTIADARKMHLLPSVTNILGVIAKPQLETWKLNNVAMAALRTTKTAEESDEYWCKRVVEASKEQVVEAADLGSRIHEALELATAGEPYADELRAFVEPVLKWKDAEGIEITDREVVLVNGSEGYAGRCDAVFLKDYPADGERVAGVLDFKTRKTEPGKKVAPYDGQGAQLAAYAWARFPHCWPLVECVNVYISTTEPGRIEIHRHEDPNAELDYFRHCAAIWRHLKGYDPRAAVAMEGAS